MQSLKPPGTAPHIAHQRPAPQLMLLPGVPALPRKRAKTTQPERQLQAAMVRFFAIAVPRGEALLFAVPNGEDRHFAVAAMLVGMAAADRDLLEGDDALVPAGQGVLPGAPDLILITRGHVDPVEVKVPKSRRIGPDGKLHTHYAGRLSRMQGLFHDLARRLDFEPVVIHTLEEWAALLEARGLRLRTRDLRVVVMQPQQVLALHNAPGSA